MAWAFLGPVVEHKAVRPWLIVRQSESAMGTVSFAVPRLAPDSGWADGIDYRLWERATWQGKTTGVADILTVDAAAERLPKGPTKPRWMNRARLTDVALRADFDGRSAARIVTEDGEDGLAADRARSVRKEINNARGFLAALGALPWAAFPQGALPRGRPGWWTDWRFAEGLARWRHDATNLTWRASREPHATPESLRQAGALLRRAQWVEVDPLALAHARGLVLESARTHDGPYETWLEEFAAWPRQTPDCRTDLVARAKADGSTIEHAQLWRRAHGPVASVVPR